MKRYEAFDIEWDTDGENVDLPTTCTFTLDDDDDDPSIYGADKLSDKIGWCVKSFSFK